MNEQSLTHSTQYDRRFASNNLMHTYLLEYPENGELEERLDLGDWKFTSLIKRIKAFTPYTYNGVEKFTTIINRVYGNTTAYRIVMAFNGFMHPYEIVSGTVIKLPDREELENLVKDTTQTNRIRPGTVVEIQRAR